MSKESSARTAASTKSLGTTSRAPAEQPSDGDVSWLLILEQQDNKKLDSPICNGSQRDCVEMLTLIDKMIPTSGNTVRGMSVTPRPLQYIATLEGPLVSLRITNGLKVMGLTVR